MSKTLGAYSNLCHSLKSTCNREIVRLVKEKSHIEQHEKVVDVKLHNIDYKLIIEDERVSAIKTRPTLDFSDYKYYAKDVRYYFTLEEMCDVIDFLVGYEPIIK